MILCSKTGVGREEFRTAGRLRAAVEESLRNLRTDYIDVYEMHGVTAGEYPRVEAEHLPVLEAMKREGKIRFIGITEAFESDTSHAMLRMAVRCGAWDVMMVGFNLLNTSARRTVFPTSRENGVGILGMFAVRHALVSQENLRPVLRRLVEAGEVPAGEVDLEHPLGFLLDEAGSLAEAAYRICVHDPDIDVTLSGTGDIAHLEANIAAANKPPLSAEALAKLDRIFAAVDSESAKSPNRSW